MKSFYVYTNCKNQKIDIGLLLANYLGVFFGL